jgi:hypothetical protein
MGSIKIHSFLLAVIMGLAAMFISLGLLGLASPALAQEPEAELNVPVAQATPDVNVSFTVFFTDPGFNIQITDLAGNPVGEGEHGGQVRCNRNNCSQATQLQLNGITYEYKFKTRQDVDPIARRVIVSGKGTLFTNGRSERFEFVAIFQDNQDGTVTVRYEASRPDASFIIPRSPGRFEFGSQ